MVYLAKNLGQNREVAITNGEIVLPVASIRDLDPETIGKLVLELAADYEFLREYLGSGELDFSSIEQAKEYVRKKQQEPRAREIKKKLVKKRRTDFSAKRTQLMLALIDRDGYVCKHPGCDSQDELTIDHIIPLSRGGTDELDNLRLLCRRHNAEKGDGMPD